MDGNNKISRRLFAPTPAIWILSLMWCCGSAIVALYVATGFPSSVSNLLDAVEWGLLSGLMMTLIVGTCASFAPKRAALQFVITSSLVLSSLIAWLVYASLSAL
jgi:hypothetical protein